MTNELAILLRAMTPSLANLNAIIKETNAYLAGKITAQVVIGASPATRQNLTALNNQLTTLGRSATQTTVAVNNAQQTMLRNEQRNLQQREQMYKTHTTNVGNMFAHHMKSMAAMMAIFGTMGLLKEGLVDFESGMAGVKQTLEETYKEMHKTLGPEEMARIAEGFSTIAERWGESSNEILEAAKSWSRQYKDVQTVQNLVNNSVLLSVVDNVPLEQSVRSLEAVLNQWQLIAKTAEEANQYSRMVVDSWSALAHKQMATATDLSAANAKMGAVSAQMGLDFAHAQGLITASLRATGFKGAEIGNMWKSVLGSIHSDKAIKELDELGVAAKDLEGNFRPVQDVLLDLMVAMKGTEVNQEELLKAVAGGKFQWAKLAASLGDVETYLNATAISINSTGKAAEYMHAQMDTISRKAGKLHQSLIALVAAGGNSGLNGVIKSIIDNLRYFVDGLNSGGMQVVAFGGATYLAVKAIDNISMAIKTATAAQKSWNVTAAISQALIGNWAAIAGTAIVVGAVGLTVALGKQADAEKELIEVNKNKLEQQKAMIAQYDNEIKYVNEVEQTRNKLISSMDGMTDADQRKIELNKVLSSSEEALSQVIGEEALQHLKSAGFTQEAFQVVVESLKDKQNAEKIAWQNTSKLVSDATNNLRKNILNQIEQIGKATEAYGILGKLQENGLWVEKELIYARYQISPTPDNARAFDEIEARISKFYKNQANNRINELTSQLAALGGVVSDFTIPDIPTSGFKSIIGDDEDDGSKSKNRQEPSKDDPTPAIINEINAQAKLTEEKNKAIQADIDLATSNNDYSAQLSKTNLLISGQTDQINDLQQANYKLMAEGDKIGAWGYIDKNGEATKLYYDIFNNSSVEAQKNMSAELASLSAIQKAINTNTQSILATKDAQDKLRESRVSLAKDMAQQVVDTAKKVADIELKNEKELIQTKLDNAEKELNSYKKVHEKIIKNYDEELDTFKNTHQKIIDGYQAEIDALDAKNDAEQEELDRQEKLLNIQNAQLDLQKAQEALANAEKEKNTRIYVEGEGWTWQSDPKVIKENQDNVERAQDALAQTTKDYQEWEKQTALKHQKELLQNQIKAEQDLIKVKEESIAAEKKYQQDLIDSKQEWYDNLNDQLSTEMTNIQTEFDIQWKNIDTMADNLLKKYGDNIDAAVAVLSEKLKNLNTQFSNLAYNNAHLPDSLSTNYSGSSSSQQTVYGNATDIANAQSAAQAAGKSSNFNFVTVSDGNASSAKSGDIVLGGSAVISNAGSGTQIAGYTANDTLNSFKSIAGFSEGGEVQNTGLHLLHGKIGKPERVLSAEQTLSFNKLVKDLPSISSMMDKIMINNPMNNMMNGFKQIDFSRNIKSASNTYDNSIRIDHLELRSDNVDNMFSQLKQRARLGGGGFR